MMLCLMTLNTLNGVLSCAFAQDADSKIQVLSAKTKLAIKVELTANTWVEAVQQLSEQSKTPMVVCVPQGAAYPKGKQEGSLGQVMSQLAHIAQGRWFFYRGNWCLVYNWVTPILCTRQNQLQPINTQLLKTVQFAAGLSEQQVRVLKTGASLPFSQMTDTQKQDLKAFFDPIYQGRKQVQIEKEGKFILNSASPPYVVGFVNGRQASKKDGSTPILSACQLGNPFLVGQKDDIQDIGANASIQVPIQNTGFWSLLESQQLKGGWSVSNRVKQEFAVYVSAGLWDVPQLVWLVQKATWTQVRSIGEHRFFSWSPIVVETFVGRTPSQVNKEVTNFETQWQSTKTVLASLENKGKPRQEVVPRNFLTEPQLIQFSKLTPEQKQFVEENNIYPIPIKGQSYEGSVECLFLPTIQIRLEQGEDTFDTINSTYSFIYFWLLLRKVETEYQVCQNPISEFAVGL